MRSDGINRIGQLVGFWWFVDMKGSIILTVVTIHFEWASVRPVNEYCVTLKVSLMRYIAIILLIFSVCSCQRIKQNENGSKLRINFYVEKDYYVPYNRKLNYEPANDSIWEKRFDVRLSIVNNSDSVITYWTMTCDWQRSFIVNNLYIGFQYSPCDNNSPHQVKIKAHDSIQIKSTLVRNIEFDNPCKGCVGCWADQGHVQTTKIGLIFIDSSCKSIADYDNWISDKSRWNIIWSNPLNLRK